MKKMMLATAILFPLMVNAAMNITTNEHVAQSLRADVLQVDLGYEEQDRNQDAIKKHLNAIVSTAKEFDPKGEICRGGGYHLSPRYAYNDKKREFITYSGNLNFWCEFKTIEEYNMLIAKIDKVLTPSIRKTEGALTWGVSEKIQKIVKQSLRLELLKTARAQAETFSMANNMECVVESVNFIGEIQPRSIMMKSMMINSVATESPIQKEEVLSIDATVNYRCTDRVK